MENDEKGHALRMVKGRHCRNFLRASRGHFPGTTVSLLPSAAGSAFTLLEIVIALTIIAILVGASIPSFRGLKDEQVAREPMAELSKLAKEARLHAMKEKRPYQIVFTEKGFSATRYLSPYIQAAELDKFLQQAQVDEENNEAIQANAPIIEGQGQQQPSTFAASQPGQPSMPAGFKEWTRNYNLPDGTNYTVQFWHEPTPTAISGDSVKLWVFQPSGICPPVTVHLERASAMFEASFSALSADIVKESSEMK
jgi:prepilin-type N-terminal cleavage/methylation domain-containing protein